MTTVATTASHSTPSATAKTSLATGVFEPCDTCGHRSCVKAIFPVGFLTFCGHHFQQNERGLVAAGADIEDSRSELLGR